MPIHAVLRDVDRSAHEPLRVRDPARLVENRRVRFEPRDFGLVHARVPEPFDAGGGALEEFLERLDLVALHELRHVGVLDDLGGWLPHDGIGLLGHAGILERNGGAGKGFMQSVRNRFARNARHLRCQYTPSSILVLRRALRSWP